MLILLIPHGLIHRFSSIPIPERTYREEANHKAFEKKAMWGIFKRFSVRPIEYLVIKRKVESCRNIPVTGKFRNPIPPK